MKKNVKLLFSAILLILFAFWTVAVKFIDVANIGPNESAVGFSTINGFFHSLTGTNFALYTITDWLGLVPFGVCLCFGALGFAQMVARKSLRKVDADILILGGFYIVVIAAYLFFEKVVINYRPVLIGGILEASYPSSTTMLTMCVMPTAILQLSRRIKNKAFKYTTNTVIVLFTAFMVVGRVLSGVHWLTDIVGGALLSAGLVLLYDAVF